MRLLIASTLILAGCGSAWTIRVDEELPIGCAKSNFYPDADQDGWGDRDADPQALCGANQAEGLTASNGRDCDDGDQEITGLVGAICPSNLMAIDPGSAPIQYGGVITGDSEFVFVYGDDTPTERYTLADSACEGWAGSDDVDGTWVPRGALATFASEAELAAVQDRIEAEVGGGVYAGFIGIEWDGTSVDDGAWSWVDDSADNLIEQALNWCNGEPNPIDFFPNLNPDNPEHAPAIAQEISRVRIALVLPSNGNWCLGLPEDAVGGLDTADPVAMAYSFTDAHFICGRPKPNAADYEESASAGAGEGATSE